MTLISDADMGLWFATNWSSTSHSGVKNSFKSIECIVIPLLQNHVSFGKHLWRPAFQVPLNVLLSPINTSQVLETFVQQVF